MPKKRRSVTLDDDVFEWILQQLKEKRFSDVSHALNYAVYQLMKKEKEG